MKFKQTNTTFWHKNTTFRAQSEKNFWAQPIGRMESYGDLNGHRLWWPPAGEHLKFHNYVTNRRIIELFIYLNSSHKARLRKNHVCGQWQVVTFDQWPVSSGQLWPVSSGQLWPLLTTGHFSPTTDMIFNRALWELLKYIKKFNYTSIGDVVMKFQMFSCRWSP